MRVCIWGGLKNKEFYYNIFVFNSTLIENIRFTEPDVDCKHVTGYLKKI